MNRILVSLLLCNKNYSSNFIGIQTTHRKLSRKRTRNPKEHKANRKKQNVQKGEEYMTASGKTVMQKVFHAQTTCLCTRKCSQHINSERQKRIFNTFYELQNWTQKTLFLRTLFKRAQVKENLNPIINLAKRNTQTKYYLSDENGTQHQVCMSFLVNCIQINRTKMFTTIQSMTSNETAKDHRGNFPKKKINENDVAYVKDFINSFPTYESHYSNKSTRSIKKYLSPFLTMTKMYREYCLKCNFKRKKPILEWKFREIFNTKFNLSFARLKVDTCRKCDMFEASMKSQLENSSQRMNLEQTKNEHLQLVEKTKKEFHETVQHASNPENKTEVYTFDLQRALETPVLQTSEVYYMRQLWVYNLCIYDEVRKIAYMCVWNESIASRGAQEIASCLHKFFMKFVPKDTQKIILRSDACSGQNRNIKMALMLKYFFSMWNRTELCSIEQHFYVSGHSYNSCDRSFGLIEKQKQITENIYIPEHWINVIEQSKKNVPKFVVIQMSKHDFFSSKPLEELITNRKKSKMGEKINWLNVQKIIYEKFSPFMLDFVNYGAEVPITISLQKKGATENFTQINLPLLYPQFREIAYLKYKDLQKLLQYIPAKFHKFYQSLKHDNSDSINDFALADRESDSEHESDEI